mmetsp:Transcript_26336/g.48228  ORF Transcript_26336/g.48228 Transcript_26336/m.48228 type:complete len:163 (-) Transcript_26336:559-1047(-)
MCHHRQRRRKKKLGATAQGVRRRTKSLPGADGSEKETVKTIGMTAKARDPPIDVQGMTGSAMMIRGRDLLFEKIEREAGVTDIGQTIRDLRHPGENTHTGRVSCLRARKKKAIDAVSKKAVQSHQWTAALVYMRSRQEADGNKSSASQELLLHRAVLEHPIS